MSRNPRFALPVLNPDTLTAGVEIANLISDAHRFRSLEDCAREIVRAVQQLQRAHASL